MFNIIVDNCFDIDTNENKDIVKVPFYLNINGEEYVDKNLSRDQIIEKMSNSKQKVSTSCPTTNDYFNSFLKDKINFVVTISSKLSGSYNSALSAKLMFEEQNPDSKIIIFDSMSAAGGENLVVYKLKKLIEDKKTIEEIVEETNSYIKTLKTFFILESYDNLVKNGRMSSLKATIASLLHVFPIMGDDGDGKIALKHVVRGRNNAFSRLIKIIGENSDNSKVLAITHVNNEERANQIKNEIEALNIFSNIIVLQSSSLSTVYADNKGIIIVY